jgi:tetratricopeptide (TPR) repeat protein
MRAALAVALMLLVVACASNDKPPVSSEARVFELVESGSKALEAGDAPKALAAFEAAIKESEFQALETSSQREVFAQAGMAAAQSGDMPMAHEKLVTATGFQETTPALWLLRAEFALRAEKLIDAGESTRMLASRWPSDLANSKARSLVREVTRGLADQDRRSAQYLDLVGALFEAGYEEDFGIQPDHLWADLVIDRLSKDDLARAREIAQRIDTPSTLLKMSVDRRFDLLVKTEPQWFDLHAAVRRNSLKLKRAVSTHPRTLDAFVQYGYALLEEGRFEELIADCDSILLKISEAANSPAFDDLEDMLPWVLNHKADALSAVGEWDEALTTLEASINLPPFSRPNVSQRINLGMFYSLAERPEQALAAVKSMDCSVDLSPYGCLQLHYLRHRAHLQLGHAINARLAYQYLLEHRSVDESAVLSAMIRENDFDPAAEMLISMLEDPNQRPTALLYIQDYLPKVMTPQMKAAQAQLEQVLARPDVSAAIEKVGRRISVPFY